MLPESSREQIQKACPDVECHVKANPGAEDLTDIPFVSES